MNNINEFRYNFLSNFVLRIPFKSTSLTSIDYPKLAEFAQENKEALYFSSYALYKEINSSSNLEKLLSKKEKVCLSLLKYYQRSKFRCTPFGLFAACGTGKWDDENKAPTTHVYTRRTDLDMHYSVVLCQHLTSLEFIRKHLLFYPNSSIYISGSKLRYTEYFDQKVNRAFQLSQVDHSIYLDKILELSQNGAMLEELAQCLVDEQISIADAEFFITDLVNAQILVSELEPAVTGNELTTQLLECLKRIQNISPNSELNEIINVILTILEKLGELDQKFTNSMEKYDELISIIHQLNIPYDIDKLFQVDLFLDAIETRSTPYCLDEKIQKKLINVFNTLSYFTFTTGTSHLTQFKEAVMTRYEGRFVQILEAMDSENGIGYGFNMNQSGDVNPIIDNLSFQDRKQDDISFFRKEIFLFNKLKKANEEGEYTMQINPEELQDLAKSENYLPDSIFAYFNVLNKGTKGVSKIHLKSFSGPSATAALGRFANGHSGIFDIVKHVADSEERINSGKILAEICHLPENRTGNILLRPHIRKYEIPYLAKSDLPKKNQLDLNDIYVGVINDRIVLWSKKHQKEVLPRMANTHDFSHKSLPVYHFLCDLQFQNVQTGLFFEWRSLAKLYSFFPRVEIDAVIVQPATWVLKKQDYSDLTVELFNEQPEKIFEWKRKWKLPDKFYLTEYDNDLMIHFHESNPLLIKLFLSEIKKKRLIILKEFLFDMEDPLIMDDHGNGYTNEFIAPLVRSELKIESFEKVNIQNYRIQEQFAPGSEWLYYKLYCGVKSGDLLLIEKILPLVQFTIEQGLIDSWFFIRYEDPDPHLRLRFHLNDKSNTGKIMEIVNESLKSELSNGTIWKIQLDTYKRELSRYTEHFIEYTETIFSNDSNYVSEMVAYLKGPDADEKRWVFALVSINRLLDDFKINITQKIAFLESFRISFGKEFNVNKATKIQIDKRYRSKKSMIEKVFEDPNQEFIGLYKILEKRTKSNSLIVQRVLNNIESNKEDITLWGLLSSYTHMHLNRVFRSKQRANEMMVYDFLHRYLRSLNARIINSR